MPGLIDRITSLWKPRAVVSTPTTIDEQPPARASAIAFTYSTEWDRRSKINEAREMYKDARVKRILGTIARDATRAGFSIESNDPRAVEVLTALVKRIHLTDVLDDWTRQTFRDGDIFLEVGIGADLLIDLVTRKPTLEMRRASDARDQFPDPTRAFWHADQMWMSNDPPPDALWFAAWQIVHGRWAHDEGSRYGTPMFAEAGKPFRRLDQGETDIAVRRHTRAGQRLHHTVEGEEGDVIKYQERNKDALENPFAAQLDFFSNKPGGISVIQGDAHLEEIGDVMHHLHTMWTASILPMSLIAYGQDLNRDILNEQRDQYNDDLPTVTKWVEDEFVRPVCDLQLLLMGILPESATYKIAWVSRQILTPMMLKDLATAATLLRSFGLNDETILTLIGQFTPNVKLTVDMLAGNEAGRLADIAAGAAA